MREPPAVDTMASVVHHEPSELTGVTCSPVLRWIETNGYGLNGPERALLFERGPDGITTIELQFPIERRTQATSPRAGE